MPKSNRKPWLKVSKNLSKNWPNSNRFRKIRGVRGSFSQILIMSKAINVISTVLIA
jgi:hypothetical protein